MSLSHLRNHTTLKLSTLPNSLNLGLSHLRNHTTLKRFRGSSRGT